LCYFTGCVLDRPSHLITNPFACQLIVPGCSANALFEPAGETSASSGKALFRSPQSGPPRGILYIIVSGRLRTGLVEHNVRHESDSYTRDTPRKSFHLTNLLAIGCTYREGRVARTRKPTKLHRKSGSVYTKCEAASTVSRSPTALVTATSAYRPHGLGATENNDRL
jgi:hypothetical protein